MSTNDNLRRRALLGATRNGEAHECMVEYTVPISTEPASSYYGIFGSINITNINWPEGITKIFGYSFRGCRIDSTCFNSIPSTVTQIYKYAFWYSSNLTGSITLPPNLQVLGDYALYAGLFSSITLPETPCIFATYSLSNTANLTEINVSENIPYAFYNNALVNSKWVTNQSNGNVYLGKNYIQYKGTMPSNTDLVLEPGTLSIAGGAFQNKTQLNSISIPNTVQYIGPYAFSGCTGLTSIDIPESLNKNLYKAFYQSITITGSSTGEYANEQPSSPFYSSKCTGITTVNWNAIDGYGGFSGSANYMFLGGGTYLPNLTTVNFGSRVEVIPAYTCYGLTKLTSITIPSSVRHIGSYAFYGCTGLTSFTIPENVERLSSSSILSGCTGITTINYNAINACRAADTNFNTSNSYTSIWGTLSNLTTLNIGNQVQTIPGGFLNGLTRITSITIPSSVTRIDYGAFYGSKVTTFDIPSSVTSIGNYAFYSNSQMTSVTVRATTPPTLDTNNSYTFPTTGSFTIYVPSSSVNTYKNATGWSRWASKIQAIS